MVWKRLFGTPNTPDTDDAIVAAQRDSPSTTPPSPGTLRGPENARNVPPHLAQIIEKRSPGSAPERTPEQRKLEGLRRQRMTMLFDIEQGETAAAPDNPWTQRMALLTEAMATVEQDFANARVVVPGPYVALPETAIAIDSVTIDQVATVVFTIGTERFVYAEDPDWADRSRTITRGDLQPRTGSAGSLVPESTPLELREQFEYHLGESLLVLATTLRDRALDDEPMPSDPTLADLARPCPVCGGWTDWRGTCQICAKRQATLAALRRESTRLLDERTREADERHRLVEGLPLARRRLRDVEAELARLGEQIG